MKTDRVAKTALAAGLSASAVVAQSACSTVLVPTYTPPAVASGWQAQLIVGGLTKPRSIEFDSEGNLLVVESGKGVTRITFADNGGTCLTASQSSLLLDDKTLNHGLAVSNDGKTIYASTVEAVFAYDNYDAKAGTVTTQGRSVIANMSNNDLVTRTLLMSKKKDGTLLVSRGSADANAANAQIVSSGLSQIRAFDLTNLTSGSKAYNYNNDGLVLGWGLRNSVGVGEHPVTGGIYAVENSVDGATRDGKDVHENNPGEELNFFGYLNGTTSQTQGKNFGYPHCYAVWDVSEIPDNAGLTVGQQFAIQENSTLSDEICAEKYIAPRLTFPAHYSPLDIKFSSDGATAYITFHGSFDKTNPVGYRLSSVAFNAQTGEPTASADSTSALTDIMTSPNSTACPSGCFRPVGLAWDKAGRLWLTSDTTGEIYVLQQSTSAPSSTASGTIVTPTASAKNAAGLNWSWETKVLGYAAVFVLGAWLL
ncbi:soluble quino protein glucose/sorbosone dehydrogenase [Diplogelasinospora grovesii]|uniref:Soluble quino protein glucose/sorbosone dehydrogenase n=1 Tax=Diplogelasinospora grovesii TaxID=303347 RepID=A0AAN6MXX5_9PEZI|nr:soluble quino protein glucose/sorbosone dehydrogenase [Diplogelasinospora grovesii]